MNGSESDPERSRERETKENMTVYCLRFFLGCFRPRKRSADAVNCLLTWAFSTAEGMGRARPDRAGGRRQVYSKRNALISLFAEGG